MDPLTDKVPAGQREIAQDLSQRVQNVTADQAAENYKLSKGKWYIPPAIGEVRGVTSKNEDGTDSGIKDQHSIVRLVDGFENRKFGSVSSLLTSTGTGRRPCRLSWAFPGGDALRAISVFGCLLFSLEEVAALVTPEQVFADPKAIALAKAVADGNPADVRRMLTSRVDVKTKGRKGLTVTHFALYAKQNAPEVLRLILRAGADPVSTLEDGNDFPHYAAARDHADPDFIAVLLDHGVSPDSIGGGVKTLCWMPPCQVVTRRLRGCCSRAAPTSTTPTLFRARHSTAR